MFHKYLLNASRGRVSWGNVCPLIRQYFIFLGVRKFPWGVSDGLEPPTLSLCSLRLDFTTKYAMRVFGIGNLIQTDSGRKRFPESWTTWHPGVKLRQVFGSRSLLLRPEPDPPISHHCLQQSGLMWQQLWSPPRKTPAETETLFACNREQSMGPHMAPLELLWRMLGNILFVFSKLIPELCPGNWGSVRAEKTSDSF